MDFKTTFIRKQIKKHENTPTLTHKKPNKYSFQIRKMCEKAMDQH